ncbi:MAG TPA: FtsX-like permease family protein [Acidimicrobiales bacterium]|nr:FtsX-like permease family protein [Acidimicrobiales bacterium]
MATDLTTAPAPPPASPPPRGRRGSGGMAKVALRGLMDHKGRLVSTVLAVGLGVAFVAGVLMLTDTMNKSFDDLFATAFEGTDAVVRSSQTIDAGDAGGGPEIRSRIDASLLDTVLAAPGVADAEGSVQGYARIIDKDGDPVGNPSMGPPTFGGNWQTVDRLNGFTIDEGRPPESRGEVVIDRGSANDTGYQVGDRVPIQTGRASAEYDLVGIARFGNADSPGGATYSLWTTNEAQQLVGEPGKYDSIGVVADSGVSQTEVARSVRNELRSTGDTGLQVLTGRQITEESQSDLKDQLSFITYFLLAFAIVSVLVGIFVIYNAFSIIVAQRGREMALVRAVGASRRQVRRSVFVEALAIGVGGSIIGFVLGLGVASVLVSLFDLPGSLVVRPSAAIIALAVGVVVTVVSALFPAWRASRVPPVAAMRDLAIESGKVSRARLVAGIVTTVAGLALVFAGADQRSATLVGLGVALALVGLILLGPALARPFGRGIGAPIGRLRGVTGDLAKENAGRNPVRTAATARALMIGVGIVSFFLVVNASLRASIDQFLDDSFTGDFVIDAGDFGMVGLPTEVAERVSRVPGVAEVVPVRFSPARVEGDDTFVTGSSPAIFGLFDGFRIVDGSDSLAAGTILLTADEARSLGVSVGDSITADFVNTGQHSFTVGGTYRSEQEGTDIGDFVLGLDDFDAAVGAADVTDSSVFVQLRPGTSVSQVQPEIEDAVADFPTANVQSVDEYKDAIGGQFDAILALMLGLLALALFIAFIGIANTIALSVLERTRELGLLRAVGMSRRQLRSMIRWESAIIAVFGTLLGLVIGLLGGWGLIKALSDEGFTAFEIPWGQIVAVVLIAAALGIFAAVWPAWRAGRMNVLDAIHTE